MDMTLSRFVPCLRYLVSSLLFSLFLVQEAEALASLTKVCSGLLTARLISLDLSDNALGEKGVRACADILKAQVGGQRAGLGGEGCVVQRFCIFCPYQHCCC